MTLLAIRLFMGKALGRLLEALRWLMAHPVHFALIVALCAAFWQYRGKQAALSDLAACETKSAQLSAAIDAANKLAEQARAKSVTIAKDADNADTINRADNRARTRTHFAANRLPDQSGISAPAEGSLAQGNQDAPAVSFMALSEADALIAADLQTYANTCHRWAQDLQAAGLAD